MRSSSTKEKAGHFKRVVYACIGIALIVLGLLTKAIDGLEFPLWRRLWVIGGGLFFLYVASTYYLPKSRRKRAELETLLIEAEAEEGERTKLR